MLLEDYQFYGLILSIGILTNSVVKSEMDKRSEYVVGVLENMINNIAGCISSIGAIWLFVILPILPVIENVGWRIVAALTFISISAAASMVARDHIISSFKKTLKIFSKKK